MIIPSLTSSFSPSFCKARAVETSSRSLVEELFSLSNATPYSVVSVVVDFYEKSAAKADTMIRIGTTKKTMLIVILRKMFLHLVDKQGIRKSTLLCSRFSLIFVSCYVSFRLKSSKTSSLSFLCAYVP